VTSGTVTQFGLGNERLGSGESFPLMVTVTAFPAFVPADTDPVPTRVIAPDVSIGDPAAAFVVRDTGRTSAAIFVPAQPNLPQNEVPAPGVRLCVTVIVMRKSSRFPLTRSNDPPLVVVAVTNWLSVHTSV